MKKSFVTLFKFFKKWLFPYEDWGGDQTMKSKAINHAKFSWPSRHRTPCSTNRKTHALHSLRHLNTEVSEWVERAHTYASLLVGHEIRCQENKLHPEICPQPHKELVCPGRSWSYFFVHLSIHVWKKINLKMAKMFSERSKILPLFSSFLEVLFINRCESLGVGAINAWLGNHYLVMVHYHLDKDPYYLIKVEYYLVKV